MAFPGTALAFVVYYTARDLYSAWRGRRKTKKVKVPDINKEPYPFHVKPNPTIQEVLRWTCPSCPDDMIISSSVDPPQFSPKTPPPKSRRRDQDVNKEVKIPPSDASGIESVDN